MRISKTSQSVNHHRLTYMATFISNYLTATVALGLIFIKMHHCASSLMTCPPKHIEYNSFS